MPAAVRDALAREFAAGNRVVAVATRPLTTVRTPTPDRDASSAWEARPPAPLFPGSPIPAFVLSQPVRSFSSLITAPVLAWPLPASANSRRPPLRASGAHGADNVTCRPGPGPPAPPAKTVAVPGRGPAAGTA